MTKDLIKWLALNGVKRSMEEWIKLRDQYFSYLDKETDPVARDKWISLIQEANHYLAEDRRLLKEVDEYEL